MDATTWHEARQQLLAQLQTEASELPRSARLDHSPLWAATTAAEPSPSRGRERTSAPHASAKGPNGGLSRRSNTGELLEIAELGALRAAAGQHPVSTAPGASPLRRRTGAGEADVAEMLARGGEGPPPRRSPGQGPGIRPSEPGGVREAGQGPSLPTRTGKRPSLVGGGGSGELPAAAEQLHLHPRSPTRWRTRELGTGGRRVGTLVDGQTVLLSGVWACGLLHSGICHDLCCT